MENSLQKNRAWIEIDLSNLKHNIDEIKTHLSPKTKIMSVVKGNAYGHGLVPISKYLNKIGIHDFAVATLQEGISLRNSGIVGNILILGYTSLENIKYVKEFNLIQTIVDEEYAKKLSKLNYEVNVHIKINTGMNRIGISYQEMDKVKDIYHYQNLRVLGIFSHLSSSEQYQEEDIAYTHIQINRFQKLVKALKAQGIDIGKVHLQSSYGFINYPELEFDYVRIGMIMYGNHSELAMKLKFDLNLNPVLSLKSRITSVKVIDSGEFVGYDRTYQASSMIKIATISIGYADGYPRNLSNGNAFVFIKEKYAPIIGKICMDQFIIDVTNMDVKSGDIVTLIGNCEKVRAEYLAFQANTITNELLSRLGSRLEAIYFEKK